MIKWIRYYLRHLGESEHPGMRKLRRELGIPRYGYNYDIGIRPTPAQEAKTRVMLETRYGIKLKEEDPMSESSKDFPVAGNGVRPGAWDQAPSPSGGPGPQVTLGIPTKTEDEWLAELGGDVVGPVEADCIPRREVARRFAAGTERPYRHVRPDAGNPWAYEVSYDAEIWRTYNPRPPLMDRYIGLGGCAGCSGSSPSGTPHT